MYGGGPVFALLIITQLLPFVSVFCSSSNKQLDESKVVWRAGRDEEKFMVDYGTLGLGFSQCLVSVWRYSVSRDLLRAWLLSFCQEKVSQQERWFKCNSQSTIFITRTMHVHVTMFKQGYTLSSNAGQDVWSRVNLQLCSKKCVWQTSSNTRCWTF